MVLSVRHQTNPEIERFLNQKYIVQNMKLFLLLLVAGTLAACSPYRVKQNRVDQSANFQSYRTFNFMESDLAPLASREVSSQVIDQIKSAVAGELTRRGYQQTSGNADLMVNLGLSVQEKTQTRETNIREAPLYIGQRRYSWRSQEVPVGKYQEGALSVDVADARTNQLLWDATVTSVLTKRSAEPEKINEAVARLFEKFPAGAR
jgi:hypothetical protein